MINICVIIPCYRVRNQILEVISSIPSLINKIYVIDDYCPEGSGAFLSNKNTDNRVEIIFHKKNTGVGGAVKNGYQKAFKDGFDIAIKIDGDGQMDPALIPKFILPLIHNKADYTKGNRFFKLKNLKAMPKVRLFGNSGLSFITKLSTGHWNIMDPTNGYTAIRLDLLDYIDLDSIDNRYFFETDLLYQLGLIRARVVDIPMVAVYEDENSSLSIKKVLFEFSWKHFKLVFRRIGINYFLRDFNIGSIFLIVGVIFTLITIISGVPLWVHNADLSLETPVGTVIKYLLFSLIGLGGITGWIMYDIFSQPNNAITDLLENFELERK
ncbi:MAG: glycosyltransferase family 2 protein [Burkholderiales bacterium]|nr:glycosyltransferase family 2 protein [Burkholderiales bacterium]